VPDMLREQDFYAVQHLVTAVSSFRLLLNTENTENESSCYWESNSPQRTQREQREKLKGEEGRVKRERNALMGGIA